MICSLTGAAAISFGSSDAIFRSSAADNGFSGASILGAATAGTDGVYRAVSAIRFGGVKDLFGDSKLFCTASCTFVTRICASLLVGAASTGGVVTGLAAGLGGS
ncbi:hypothetical protein [Hydrogenimonas sp.]